MRIEEITYNADGLVPAILVDNATDKVLMMAWMNRESLQRTLDTKLACFWSRSRQELWTKGETSGNYMHVISVIADCDADTLLVRVVPDGPACHTGTETCFTQEILAAQNEEMPWALDDLYALLQDRKATMPEGSYTSYLFEKGVDKILKKVGEECTEVIIAAKAEDRAETIYELADLAYHAMVLMVEQGIGLDEVKSELAGRHVIDKKVKQEKMTGDAS